AVWMVRISRSSVLDRGCQDLPRPCCPARTHTCPACITIMLVAHPVHHGGLWPRRHAAQEPFVSRPPVIGAARRHRRRNRLPPIDCAVTWSDGETLRPCVPERLLRSHRALVHECSDELPKQG